MIVPSLDQSEDRIAVHSRPARQTDRGLDARDERVSDLVAAFSWLFCPNPVRVGLQFDICRARD